MDEKEERGMEDNDRSGFIEVLTLLLELIAEILSEF